MTNEEKQQLLKDLCARFPYGVKCYVDDHLKGKLTVIPHSMLDMDGFECHTEDWKYEQFYSPDELTPYLRPMSSMTEEEDKEWQLYKGRIAESCDELLEKRIAELYDWFCKKHLDYRGLIPIGLALPALEGMYEIV